ncbi:MAG: DegT/DnrJ/EryC1/StrS family aminotransferase [Marinobacter sp.]
MSLSKLRPVGSRVPLPMAHSDVLAAPWAEHYESAFVNSGTAALSLAVKLSIKSKQTRQTPEVILPAYGCPDLVAAVVARGARPVLVDLMQGRPWMNLDALESAVTENTVGIIAVGFLGIPERLFPLRRIADKNDVTLIEDSAQVFPPSSSGNGLADYVVLSFGRGKPINLMGGGALLIRKDHVEQSASVLAALPEVEPPSGTAWRFRRWLFNLLLTRPLYGAMEKVPFLGIGQTVFHPLTSIDRQTPVGGLLEAGIEGFNNRKDIGAVYSEALLGLVDKGWVQLAPDCFGEAALEGPVPASPILLRYPLLAPSRQIRDEALLELNRVGIGASAFYCQALPAIDGVSNLVTAAASAFPCARDFAERLITLPSHEDVSTKDINSVADILLLAPR